MSDSRQEGFKRKYEKLSDKDQGSARGSDDLDHSHHEQKYDSRYDNHSRHQQRSSSQYYPYDSEKTSSHKQSKKHKKEGDFGKNRENRKRHYYTQTSSTSEYLQPLDVLLKFDGTLKSNDEIKKFIKLCSMNPKYQELDYICYKIFFSIKPMVPQDKKKYDADVNFVLKLNNILDYYIDENLATKNSNDERIKIVNKITEGLVRTIAYIDVCEGTHIASISHSLIKKVIDYTLETDNIYATSSSKLLKVLSYITMHSVELWNRLEITPAHIRKLFQYIPKLGPWEFRDVCNALHAISCTSKEDKNNADFISQVDTKTLDAVIASLAKMLTSNHPDVINHITDRRLKQILLFMKDMLVAHKTEPSFNHDNIYSIIDVCLQRGTSDAINSYAAELSTAMLQYNFFEASKHLRLMSKNIWHFNKAELKTIRDASNILFNFQYCEKTSDTMNLYKLGNEELLQMQEDIKVFIDNFSMLLPTYSTDLLYRFYSGLFFIIRKWPYLLNKVEPEKLEKVFSLTYKTFEGSDKNYMNALAGKLCSILTVSYNTQIKALNSLPTPIIQTALDILWKVAHDSKDSKIYVSSLNNAYTQHSITINSNKIESILHRFINDDSKIEDKVSVYLLLAYTELINKNPDLYSNNVAKHLTTIISRINPELLTFYQLCKFLSSIAILDKFTTEYHQDYKPKVLKSYKTLMGLVNNGNGSKRFFDILPELYATRYFNHEDLELNILLSRLFNLNVKLIEEKINSGKSFYFSNSNFFEIVKVLIDKQLIKPSEEIAFYINQTIRQICNYNKIELAPAHIRQILVLLNMLKNHQCISPEHLNECLALVTPRVEALSEVNIKKELVSLIATLNSPLDINKIASESQATQQCYDSAKETHDDSMTIDSLSETESKQTVIFTEAMQSVVTNIPTINPESPAQLYDIHKSDDIKALEQAKKFVYLDTNKHVTAKLSVGPIGVLGDGFGVFTNEVLLPSERPLCEYTGELTNDEDPDSDFKFPCYDRKRPDEIIGIIDARDKGDFTRFINHSDTPNLVAKARTIRERGKPPRVVIEFYVIRPIHKGEQLTFDYKREIYFKDIGYKPYFINERHGFESLSQIYTKNKPLYSHKPYQFEPTFSKKFNLTQNANWLVPSIFRAIYQGNITAVKEQLNKQPEIIDLPMIAFNDKALCPMQDQSYLTAFNFACAMGKTDIIQAMMDIIYDKKTNRPELYSMLDRQTLVQGQSPLILLLESDASNKKIIPVVNRLLETLDLKFPFNTTVDQLSIYHYAVKRNSSELLKMMLDAATVVKQNIFEGMFNRDKDLPEYFSFDYCLINSQFEMLTLYLKYALTKNSLSKGKFVQYVNENKLFSPDVLSKVPLQSLLKLQNIIKNNAYCQNNGFDKIMEARIQTTIELQRKKNPAEQVQTTNISELSIFKSEAKRNLKKKLNSLINLQACQDINNHYLEALRLLQIIACVHHEIYEDTDINTPLKANEYQLIETLYLGILDHCNTALKKDTIAPRKEFSEGVEVITKELTDLRHSFSIEDKNTLKNHDSQSIAKLFDHYFYQVKTLYSKQKSHEIFMSIIQRIDESKMTTRANMPINTLRYLG